MEPSVIYEDEAILVVNKPSGMIVHPDEVHDYPALTSWLAARYGEGGFYLVHRIDRETSGVLLVARTEAVFLALKAQFQEREIQKVYRAFVYGILKDERGIIDKPIGSARGGRGPRSATQPHGTTREAITAYRVMERAAHASYLEVFPKTGRTHQIRVHLSSIQHPLVCDVLYAPSRPPLLGFTRLALHALSLTFVHPATHNKVTFTAPLPPDFVSAEQQLRA